MNTFLPYKDFEKCAKVLDNKRLYKRIVECKQILNTLEKVKEKDSKLFDGSPYNKKSFKIAWENHPAVLMWKGYELCLRDYQEYMLREWIDRRWNTEEMPNDFELISTGNIWGKEPEWLGYECLHKSHRAMLYFKDSEHYQQFRDDYEYIIGDDVDSILEPEIWGELVKPEYYWPVTKGDKQ